MIYPITDVVGEPIRGDSEMVTHTAKPTNNSVRETLIESLRARYLEGTLDEVLFHDGVNIDRLCAAVLTPDDPRLVEQTRIEGSSVVTHQP